MSKRIAILLSLIIIILISVNITNFHTIDAVIPSNNNFNISRNSTENNGDQNYSIDPSDSTQSRTNGAPWIIDSFEMIVNETQIINRSISIKSGGELVINNSNVLINSTEEPVIITIEKDGKLKINKSKFEPHNGQSNLGYTIRVYGELLINKSILNNLCVISGACAVESCSGTSYQDTYTPGIEIYSDLVEITWSEFNLAWNSSIFISNSQPKINNNQFSNNTQSLMIVDSEVELVGNRFEYNLDAIKIETSDVKLVNLKFSQIGGYCLQSDKSNLIFENVSLEDVAGTLILLESSIYIKNSSFNYCNDLYAIDSELNLDMTTLSDFYGSFSCSNINGNISNCTFRDLNSLSIMDSDNIRIENCILDTIGEYGLFFMYSLELMIINNSIMNSEVGMFFIGSNATLRYNNFENLTQGCVASEFSNLWILNNHFFNNFQGFNIGYSNCEVFNNSFNKNTDAIVCIGAEGLIENNIITSNREGITYMYSDISLAENLIANNSWWGINITGQEPDVTEIIYSNTTEKPNGYGRVIKMANIRVHVLDSNGYSIQNADVRVTDKNHREIYNKKAYSFTSSPVLVYMVLNSEEKIELNPYTIEASWRNEHYNLNIIPGPITNVTIIEIYDYEIIVIELPLPDLYITSSDIDVSDTNPKHDDVVDIFFTVHYSGEMPTGNTVNVSVTANGAVIQRMPISFDPSDKSKKEDFKIPWTVVSWEDGPVDIKVTIDEINNIENNLLDYDDNNSAKITINVRGEKLKKSSWHDYSYACLIIIVLLVVIFFIALFILLRTKKKQKVADELTGKDTIEPPTHDEKSESSAVVDQKKEDKDALKKEKKKEKYKKKLEKKKNKNKKLKDKDEKQNKSNNSDKNETNKKMDKDKMNKDKNNDKRRKKSIEQRIRDDYTRDGPRIKW